MKKPTIYATGNERITGDYNVSYYVVEKSNEFLNWFGSLLTEVLEFSNGIFKANNTVKFIDNEEVVIKKEIKKMVDIHEKYEKNGSRIDVFYGKKRVFVTFRKSRDVREKFAEFLTKHAEWVEVEEIERGEPHFSTEETKI